MVQANILAALIPSPSDSEIYNVAVNDATSLDQLYNYLKAIMKTYGVAVREEPRRSAFRAGDIRHSRADITKAAQLLGYAPEYRIFAGLEATVPWYLGQMRKIPQQSAMPALTGGCADKPAGEPRASGAGAPA